VGIVTDRDLCLRVLALGKNPKNIQIREVMTPKPVVCHPEDSLTVCEGLMRKNQVRRMPVVDKENRLLGIVAQADLALHAPAADVSRVVTEISKPVQHRKVRRAA
jgi:CBS domain-containing protein